MSYRALMTGALLAAVATAGITSANAQVNVAPGSANDITKQQQKATTGGTNPATDQGTKVPDRTDSSISGKVQRDSSAIRDGMNPGDQGPVQQLPAGTASPKALPGTGSVPRGN